MTATAKRNLLFGLLLAGGLIMFLDPIGQITRLAGPPRTDLGTEELADFARQVSDSRQDAMDLVTTLARNTQVTFVGSYNMNTQNAPLAQECDFVAGLVRRLPENGVTIFATDILLGDDHAAIDAFLHSPEFNESQARRLLISASPLAGYTGYMDILRAAWETAQRAGGETFQLIGLAYLPDTALFKSEDDAKNKDLIRRVYGQGSPDEYMARVLLEKAKGTQSPVVVFCNRNSTLRDTQFAAIQGSYREVGFDSSDTAARLLANALGDEAVASVLFHSPWPDPMANDFSYHTWPFNGWLDQAFRHSPPILPQPPFALDLRSAALGQKEVIRGAFLKVEGTTLMSDVCQVYVVLAPMAGLGPSPVIPDFINQENLSLALRQIPAFSWPENGGPATINDTIARSSQRTDQELAPFR